MLQSERDRQDQWLRTLPDKYGSDRSALLPILQDIQAKFSYVDGHTMQVVADLLGIHPVEVYSVVSFYSLFTSQPKGRFIIRLCNTISCAMQGKDQVARQLETDLGIAFGCTTADGMFSLEWTHCLGLCDRGPALLVNDSVYTEVTPARVHEILEDCRRQFGIHALMKEYS
jgi:NADH-quinone oxidoreductase E subunit